MPLTLAAAVDIVFDEQFGGGPGPAIGVAVSGGSDSTALLHFLANWAGRYGREIRAVSVDHGLRDASASEARGVGVHCAALGVKHDILHWTGWDGQGNLQDQARQARYGLMADWAAQNGIGDIALGHTQDDQGETVLMRLARGAGVDGLAAMAPVRQSQGVRWLRPLLGLRRNELRAYLDQRGVTWVDDPSNEDPKYDRIKMRKALGVLDALGITSQGLADTAARMASVREVLDQATADATLALAKVRGGAVYLDVPALFDLPAETRRRLLAHSLCWVSGAVYQPRRAPLLELEGLIGAKKTSTLHGCLITVQKENCIIAREFSAVASLVVDPGSVWDGRWRLNGPVQAGHEIRATGEKGLSLLGNWRETGVHRSVLLGAPAVWSGDDLVAAPLAGLANGWRAELVQGENHFHTSVLSH